MKKIRNILSLALVFIMLIGLMPMNVFANGEPNPAPATHNITIVAKNGSVIASVNGVSVTEAKENDQVTLAATADNGYEFDSFTVTGETDVTVTNGIFTMPAADVTVKATFKKKLETVKTEAKEAVDNLPNLSKEEKDGFKNEIDGLDSVEAVNAKLGEATTKSTENAKAKADAEKKALEDVKKVAKAEVDKLEKLSQEDKDKFKKAIEDAADKASVDKALEAAKAKANPTKPTPVTTVKVVTIGNGTASVDNEYAIKGQTVTVTAKPYSGYAVARVYLKYNDITKNINTYYNGYYYDGRYYGRYNDYNKYLYVYENSSYYLRKYDSYREFLRHEYPSHYRYYEDYDYWTDRYDYDWYDRYDNYYYKYLDDYKRKYSDIYDNYEEYLRAKYPNHYYNYRYLDRYDYRYHNYRYGYNTSDTFDMPASDVTVYVEFTDAYPYYYDDYYYYRSRRDRKAEEAKAKAEAAKKEEEEAKAKAEAEKLPQVYENKAVIAIGSNVLDKVSKNVHTVHEMDTPAYVNNGRVMLPLRYVAEALGLQVSWVPETKTVIIWDLTQRVEIPVKSNRIIVNGITYTSDVKPEIKSSRTMLPIANIARALGLIDGSDIIWDQYNKQVTLTRKVLSK